MPILLISRHSPENCPLFNERARKVWMAYGDKFDAWSKKYGVEMLGGWHVPNEHLSVMVLEVPSLDVFYKLSTEPEWMAMSAFETYEVKAAISLNDLTKMAQQAK